MVSTNNKRISVGHCDDDIPDDQIMAALNQMDNQCEKRKKDAAVVVVKKSSDGDNDIPDSELLRACNAGEAE